VLGGSFEAVHDEIDSWCFLVRFRSFFFCEMYWVDHLNLEENWVEKTMKGYC